VLQFTATRRRSQLRLGFDYHPTTIRLSFDYRPPFDYIRLPFDHHATTIRLPFDYHSTTIRLPFDYHLTTIRLPPDYHSTTMRLPFDYHPTTIRPPFDYHSTTIRPPFDYHLTTIRLPTTIRPPFDYHSTTIRLPFDHHSTTIRLPSDYHSTTIRLPFDHHPTIIRLPFDYIRLSSDHHSTTSDYHPTTIRPPFDCSSTTSVKTNVSIFRCRSSNGRGRGWNYGRIAVESLLKFNVVISNSASKPWLLPGQLDRAEDIAVTAADGASKVRPAFSTCRAAAEAGARWRSRPTSWRGEPSSMCTTEPPCVCVPATSDLPAASPSTLPGHLRTHIYTWTDAER